VSGCTVPVICAKQDQLIGNSIDDFSDSDADIEHTSTSWTRLSYKIQLHIPKLDLCTANGKGEYDDIIAAACTSLFMHQMDTGLEVTVAVNKTMHTGITTMETEFIKKKADREKYHSKISKYLIIM